MSVLSIRNANGREVFNERNPTYYERASGKTTPHIIPNEPNVTRHYSTNSNSWQSRSGHYPLFIQDQHVGVTDIVFYRLPAQGIWSLNQYYTPWAPFNGRCQSWAYSAASSLDWKVASLTPGVPANDRYGMQVFDESGAAVFDSRHRQVVIVGGISLSRSQALDIIFNGAVKGFTVPGAELGAFVGAGGFQSATIRSDGSSFAVRLRQLSATYFEFSRVQIAERFGGSGTYAAQAVHGADFMIAK